MEHVTTHRNIKKRLFSPHVHTKNIRKQEKQCQISYSYCFSSQLTLEYTPSESVTALNTKARVIVTRRGDQADTLQIETAEGTKTIAASDLITVIKVYNKVNDECILEQAQKCDAVTTGEPLLFTFKLNLMPEKIKSSVEPIYISTCLKHEKASLIDPYTKQLVVNEKPLFGTPAHVINI